MSRGVQHELASSLKEYVPEGMYASTTGTNSLTTLPAPPLAPAPSGSRRRTLDSVVRGRCRIQHDLTHNRTCKEPPVPTLAQSPRQRIVRHETAIELLDGEIRRIAELIADT